ncbi:MAG: hypothetical protein AB1631_04060 [Acidobacteriota bacterium]
MNKKEKQLLSATLDKALAPPRKRPPLDDLLREYDDGIAILPQATVPQYRSTAVPQLNQTPIKDLIVDPDRENEEAIDSMIVPSSSVPQYRSTAVPEPPASSDFGPTSRFYRKPNNAADSIDRNLTPAESKVFDHLLRLTIGFNRDWCQVTVSALMERTGYRSDKTIRQAITGLVLKGLIARRAQHNNPQGDEYQILDHSGTAVPQYRGTAVKNTAVLESKITGVYLNTCKDMSDDDTHTLQTFTQHIASTARELMGGELPDSPQEQERWKDCACVLMDELKKAVSQTEGISSLPAFFAEHLKRKFSQKTKEPRTSRKKDISPSTLSRADGETGKTKSAFSLEECLAYAEHLKNAGQGITNPGGYGTTIYRTGEADTLIQEWLKTKDSLSIEIENCPDCKGTGFIYPNGIEGGVVRCKHPSLHKSAQAE